VEFQHSIPQLSIAQVEPDKDERSQMKIDDTEAVMKLMKEKMRDESLKKLICMFARDHFTQSGGRTAQIIAGRMSENVGPLS
jgi:hypothetical protein